MVLKKPFVSRLVHFQFVGDEILLLTVNVCIFGLAILDSKGDYNSHMRPKLGDMIIIANILVNIWDNICLFGYLYTSTKSAIIAVRAHKSKGILAWILILLSPFEVGGMDVDLNVLSGSRGFWRKKKKTKITPSSVSQSNLMESNNTKFTFTENNGSQVTTTNDEKNQISRNCSNKDQERTTGLTSMTSRFFARSTTLKTQSENNAWQGRRRRNSCPNSKRDVVFNNEIDLDLNEKVDTVQETWDKEKLFNQISSQGSRVFDDFASLSHSSSSKDPSYSLVKSKASGKFNFLTTAQKEFDYNSIMLRRPNLFDEKSRSRVKSKTAENNSENRLMQAERKQFKVKANLKAPIGNKNN